MTALKKHAYALENQYAYDEQVEFRIKAHANAAMGRWAAAALGRDADAYAKEIANSEIMKPGSALERLQADLEGAGVDVSSEEIQSRMAVALRQTAAVMRS